MKFSDRAISCTIIYLIIYQLSTLFSFLYFPEHKEIIWINQLIFATSTSLGAVFWSLFAVKKYEKFANLEDLVSKVYDDINDFRTILARNKNLLKNPILNSIFNDDDDLNDEDQDEQVEDVLKDFKSKQEL